MLAEWKREIESLKTSLADLRVSLDVPGREHHLEGLEHHLNDPGFWDDPQSAQKIMQELSRHKDKIELYARLERELEDVAVLWEIGMEEDDGSVEEEVAQGVRSLQNTFAQLHLDLLLNGPYDRHNALMTLHAGAGGTEAQDWVQMLFRMYQRWGESSGFKAEVLDLLAGDDAGIKSVTLSLQGENAYGYAKAEKGVHRLVRISPFDASSRRHTSFASVDVIPEVDHEGEIPIDNDDLKIDTYRSGGAGGQHVNKTDSAVRITHLPTGIVVQCQNERSQIQNKASAMRILMARLLEVKRKQQEEELSEIRGVQSEIAWGSQIRSYWFQPYTLVKDHRTKAETGNVSAVMDGEIGLFINAYLQQNVARTEGSQEGSQDGS
ncbi:MAG: peptide chain release factor 2 [Peptococcaceae bacterium]|nr:peptide chain release factor 2 [Peptococcaceae bacterium]